MGKEGANVLRTCITCASLNSEITRGSGKGVEAVLYKLNLLFLYQISVNFQKKVYKISITTFYLHIL